MLGVERFESGEKRIAATSPTARPGKQTAYHHLPDYFIKSWIHYFYREHLLNGRLRISQKQLSEEKQATDPLAGRSEI